MHLGRPERPRPRRRSWRPIAPWPIGGAGGGCTPAWEHETWGHGWHDIGRPRREKAKCRVGMARRLRMWGQKSCVSASALRQQSCAVPCPVAATCCCRVLSLGVRRPSRGRSELLCVLRPPSGGTSCPVSQFSAARRCLSPLTDAALCPGALTQGQRPMESRGAGQSRLSSSNLPRRLRLRRRVSRRGCGCKVYAALGSTPAGRGRALCRTPTSCWVRLRSVARGRGSGAAGQACGRMFKFPGACAHLFSCALDDQCACQAAFAGGETEMRVKGARDGPGRRLRGRGEGARGASQVRGGRAQEVARGCSPLRPLTFGEVLLLALGS